MRGQAAKVADDVVARRAFEGGGVLGRMGGRVGAHHCAEEAGLSFAHCRLRGALRAAGVGPEAGQHTHSRGESVPADLTEGIGGIGRFRTRARNLELKMFAETPVTGGAGQAALIIDYRDGVEIHPD